MIRKYFRKLLYRKVVLEGSGCTNHLLKNRIISEVIRHREAGPAIIRENGSQWWCLNGRLHREDGPAVIWSNGTQEWWLNGTMYSYEGYINELFPEDSPQRTLFILKWS